MVDDKFTVGNGITRNDITKYLRRSNDLLDMIRSNISLRQQIRSNHYCNILDNYKRNRLIHVNHAHTVKRNMTSTKG